MATVVSSTCTLTLPNGMGFDLSGVKEIYVNDSFNKYQYNLKPCSVGLNTPCGRTSTVDVIHSTQTNRQNGICVVIGQGAGKLRYIDNGLSLMYGLGDTCHNGLARTTIINFLCPTDVSTNCSSDCVTFVAEDHCVYLFEWVTDAACLPTSDSKCKFQLNNVNYNFGLLTEGTIPTYAAISTEKDSLCFLINPCGTLEVTNNSYTPSHYCNNRVAPSACAGSSVCQIKQHGDPVPMGVFDLQDSSTLRTIDHSVIGVSTKLSRKSALVQYICQTGALLTTPVFISQLTENIVEFHWYTSAACPEAFVTGSNCMVTESRTGFMFNLTSLSEHTLHFNDPVGHYHYMIRICSSFPSSLYSKGSSCANNSAVCQETGAHNYSAGQQSTELMYDDSILKLMYMNGSECSDHSRRKTSIVFLCDINVREPLVQNVTEVRHCEYLVEVKTLFACPPAYQSKECVYFASNGDTYDLLELAKTDGNWQAESSDGSVYFINVCRPLNLQGNVEFVIAIFDIYLCVEYEHCYINGNVCCHTATS